MSSLSDKTGGPAFPHDKYMKNGDQWGTYAHGGMSLRDYFAAAALMGLGVWTPDPRFEDGDDPIRYDRESVVIRRARWAYAQADAMIAARLLEAASSEAR